VAGAKQSLYDTSQVSDPTNLKIVLTKAYGVRGTVSKTRKLYLVGQTRVHIDKVDGLGNFVELEVRIHLVLIHYK
jgi:adenylate cyclase class IV